ncbi:MAG: zinc-ribbon domain-containing protein [Oscillospiraceae bacterium]|nr:zinc-ribbon domain-containing protein [Oscillospiraceae bacterium]
MDGISLTGEQVGIIIKIAVAVIIAVLILWAVRAVRRKVRRLKRTVNHFLYSGLQKLSEQEAKERQERLSTPSGSSETQGYKSNEVRVALREQKSNCSSCGAPNKGIEEFCPYCGTSLIK